MTPFEFELPIVATNRIAGSNREISLGKHLASIPERLLLAHARGEVLFMVGAGVSKSACFPDFEELVLKVYEILDHPVYQVIREIEYCRKKFDWDNVVKRFDLNNFQFAEVKRFIAGDYDTVLGMLERRIDTAPSQGSRVRAVVIDELRRHPLKPTEIHRALVNLADRGSAQTIITTNFDLLLEKAAQEQDTIIQTYTLGEIPRPGRDMDFSGILHIHGALNSDPEKASELILTDYDLGSYLRRGIVPHLIYDAARLFNLVLVGYSVNEPPMRYLMNEIASDGTRFSDVKERFIFVGSPDAIECEDWKGRGITPIPYNKKNQHKALERTLTKWATLSAVNGNNRNIEAQLKRIVRKSRDECSDSNRDLFDHLIRRANSNERKQLSKLVTRKIADMGWLDAIVAIILEDNLGN